MGGKTERRGQAQLAVHPNRAKGKELLPKAFPRIVTMKEPGQCKEGIRSELSAIGGEMWVNRCDVARKVLVAFQVRQMPWAIIDPR